MSSLQQIILLAFQKAKIYPNLIMLKMEKYLVLVIENYILIMVKP
jgi:hypothetical protein